MSMDVDLVGGVTGNKAEVNTANQLKVILETNTDTNAANVGAVKILSENDSGAVTGIVYLKSPETSPDYRLRVGMDNILFSDTFNAAIQNTNNWLYTPGTMTAIQAGTGTVNFGAVQGTTSAHGAMIRSFQYFPIIGTAPLALNCTFGQFTAPLVVNEIWLTGFGLPISFTIPPTDGVWLQLTTAGLIGVLCYNGVTTQTGVLESFVSMVVGVLTDYLIVIGENEVEFWRNDIMLGEMAIPSGNGQPFLAGSAPIFSMKYNTGNVTNTNTMRLCDVTVTLMDIACNRPWSVQMALQGQAGYVGQNGHTQGKTALWTNNTAPTAVAMTNTAASFTGLGGIGAVLPTLTAQTDGILFSFQNPTPSVIITGRNLVIKSVVLQGVVSVILAGGPVIYAYALSFGMTTLTQLNTESASYAAGITSHAPRIVPIGIESYAATAAVGVLGSSGIQINLDTPIVVRPGEFVAILARNIGTVTTTGAITMIASIDSYWE